MNTEIRDELHFIVPIETIPSIMKHGILSNYSASDIYHYTVSMPEIQDRREKVQVPGGLKLHQYANLYFDARNPMMRRIIDPKNNKKPICVLRISTEVMKQDGVVITSQNASSYYVSFYSYPEGMQKLNFKLIYARYWIHDDHIEYFRHKSIKCAEVLIPNNIKADYITGAYVLNNEIHQKLIQLGFDCEITINPDIFFGEQR
ncbi:MAG: DUF4433 domain-containing protein [Methanogenium sp.]|nr:DUF4433 domain-containing protein [Methanogenium sp.]